MIHMKSMSMDTVGLDTFELCLIGESFIGIVALV